MDQLLAAEVSMFTCWICRAEESREEVVEEVFQIEGKAGS